MGEFDLIDRLFRPLAGSGGLDLRDDAAVLRPEPGFDLVMTKDLMVQGRHWPDAQSPVDVGYKLLAVNLSDLAAMGAEPIGYLLGVTLPKSVNFEWLEAFAVGLAEAQNRFGLSLLGGDTTASAPSTPIQLSLTALGRVQRGQALLRSRAQPGDAVYVSGPIGDAALALRLGRAAPDHLAHKLHRPEPRLSLGRALRGQASAAIDISDGLVADAAHLAAASGVALTVNLSDIPFSAQAAAWADGQMDRFIQLVTGGDDYELLFTGSADLSVQERIIRIGHVKKGKGVTLLDPSGQPVSITHTGFDHFKGVKA